MLFKRFSRSRSNSNSYVDSYPSPHDSKFNEDRSYPPGSNDKYLNNSAPVSAGSDTAPLDDRRDLPSSRHSDQAPLLSNPLGGSKEGMYARPSQPVEVPAMNSPTRGGPVNGYGNGAAPRASSYDDMAPTSKSANDSAPQDLLMQAFNAALRPHVNKVEGLENEIADLRAYIDQLEAQRGDVHAWIDKRGLRPDVPPSIAAQMDTASHASSPTHAAATLNAQLDRKITIVNFDLHRLQDDLNDSLPTPSFSACMLKFLPDISRLSSLPSGPRYAFDLLLKLGGNLNSHGGLENGDEEDLVERRVFYARLDEAMVEVVRGRFKEEGDSWGVGREIKRIEKTGAYLRNWGVEPYFPQTLDVMRAEGSGSAQGGAPVQSGGYA